MFTFSERHGQNIVHCIYHMIWTLPVFTLHYIKVTAFVLNTVIKSSQSSRAVIQKLILVSKQKLYLCQYRN